MRETFSTLIAQNANANTVPAMFTGGRAAVVTWLGAGGALPATLTLEYQAADGTFVPAYVITAAGIVPLDLPKGLYRVSMVGGAPSNVNVTLVTIPYK